MLRHFYVERDSAPLSHFFTANKSNGARRHQQERPFYRRRCSSRLVILGSKLETYFWFAETPLPAHISRILEHALYEAEQKILKSMNIDFTQEFVVCDDGLKINTIKLGQGEPLVLVHGFGAGVALWARFED